MLMLPEIIVIATAFAVLFADLFVAERQRGVLSFLAFAGLTGGLLALVMGPTSGEMLGGRFAMDSVAWWFKFLFILAAALTIGLSKDLLEGRVAAGVEALRSPGEYYTILLFNLSGMLFMASARDLISLYVSLELATIPLFALTAWRKDSRSGEAGLKYVIVGALASALMLYGFGLLYGLTGETGLEAIGHALRATPASWLAAALVTAGVGFKLTIVPFHMWAAEVYQGAPTPITAYLSVASKSAGLAVMFHLYYRVFGRFVEDWSEILALLAALTMTVGNLVAIVQQNIKRFMAFSAVSQAGYLILGFVGPASDAVPAMIFYLLVYLVTNLAAFAVIVFHSNQTGQERIQDYRGLSRTNPLVALAMMVALFGLAGIPPLSGFVGKFFLFSVASKAGFNWLVAVAAVNSTVSLYYYLRVIRQMYIEPAAEGAPPLRVSPVLGTTLGAVTLASVVLGIVPYFYEAVRMTTSGWLGGLR